MNEIVSSRAIDSLFYLAKNSCGFGHICVCGPHIIWICWTVENDILTLIIIGKHISNIS